MNRLPAVRPRLYRLFAFRPILPIFSCLCVAALPSPAASGAAARPGPLEISGAVRVRAEAIDGQFRPGRAESDFLVSVRTDIFAEYDAGPLRFGGELLDARGYGEKKNSSVSGSEVNTLEPLQAYVAAELPVAELRLREAGRRLAEVLNLTLGH